MTKSEVPAARPAGSSTLTPKPKHVPPAVEVRAPLHATRPAVPPQLQDREGFIAVLRGDFRYLWAAQAASQLADKFLMFTLLIFMYTLSGRASLQSAVLIAYTLPSVLLSAPAGVYADRHDKRTLMIACNLVRAGLVLLIPAAQLVPGLKGQAWPLIIITLMFSSAGQVFAPSEAASIPSLVRRNQITAATSLFMTTVILTLVLGVPAATLAIAFLGNFAPFYIAAGLFAVAGAAVWRMSTSLRAVRTTKSEKSPSLLRELREGVAILRASAALRWGLYQLALAIIVVFTVFALGPAYLVNVLGRSDQDTYIVLVPATFGLVAMGAVLGRTNIRRAVTLVAAILTAGGALIVMGVMPTVLRHLGAPGLMTPLAVLMALVFGCALGALMIPGFTLLQERSTPESRGRIFGGIFTVINAAVAVPLLLAGVIADILGVDRVVGALGLLLIIIAAAIRGFGWQRLAILEDDQQPIVLSAAE
jgi:MFS family permease